MASCDINALLANGVGMQRAGGLSQVVRIQLLRQWLLALNADADTTPSTLLNSGKCWACLTKEQRQLVKVQLLCEIKSTL